jgi:hypothetical protein
MKAKDENITQMVITKLENCSECLKSIKNVNCDDFEYRFSSYLKIKNNILVELVDFNKVKKHFKNVSQ